MILSTIDEHGKPYLVNLDEIALLEVQDDSDDSFRIGFRLSGNHDRITLTGQRAVVLFTRYVQYHADKDSIIE